MIRAHTTPRNASLVPPWEGTGVTRTALFTFIR
jgi:hypothetical protein